MPVQPTFPGVYVLEEPSGVHAIGGVATSVAAFIGMCPSGPVNVPTRVFSFREFEKNFVGSAQVGEMTDQVRQFFLNGGSTAWIVRNALNANDGATMVAQSDLRAEDATTKVLRLSARNAGTVGNEVRIEIDYGTDSPERTFNLTAYRAQVQADGSVKNVDIEKLVDLSMDPLSPRYAVTTINLRSNLVTAALPAALAPAGVNLSESGLIFAHPGGIKAFFDAHMAVPSKFIAISVAGGPPVLVNLGNATGANSAATCTEVQARINAEVSSQGVSVAVALRAAAGGEVMQITSNNGAVAISSAPSNDAAADLRLGAANGGLETDGYSALRPAATGLATRVHTGAGLPSAFARVHAFANTRASDFPRWHLESAKPAVEPPADVFTAADLFGADVGTGFTGVIGTFAAVEAALDTIVDSIKTTAGADFDSYRAGVRIGVRPKYGNQDADLKLALTSPAAAAYNIAGGGNLAQTSAKPTNVVRYALGAATPLIPGLPAGVYRDYLQAGNDGTAPVPDDYEYSFDKLERTADIFNLMILPRAVGQTDSARAAAWGPASDFCQRRRAFLLVDPPMDVGNANRWDSAADASQGAQAFRSGIVQDHAAVYWPRVVASDSKGKPIVIDPAGTMAGVFSKTDQRRGVWKAPAGLEASLVGVRGLEFAVTNMENGPTNQQAVNTLRTMSSGATSWGARTMMGYDDAPDQDYKYVPVRRLALMIEESLYRGLQFAVFEPNGEVLWGQIRLAAGAFMNGLFRQGAFKGLKASDAYYVACGPNTTSQTDINLGIVNVEVGFAPLKPAEFVVLTIRQMVGQIEV
jgi:phage tail sheath protein FI